MILESTVFQRNEPGLGVEGSALSFQNLQDARPSADIESFDKVTFCPPFRQSSILHIGEEELLLLSEGLLSGEGGFDFAKCLQDIALIEMNLVFIIGERLASLGRESTS